MKSILLALTAFLSVFIPKLMEAQSLSVNDSIEIKYIAGQLKKGDVRAGIFQKPDLNGNPRRLKSGKNVESQEGYSKLREDGIFKFFTLSPSPAFDSVIFMAPPKSQLREDARPAFFPYSGSTWLLLLKPAITVDKAPKDWIKNNAEYAKYGFLNSTTAFYLDNPYKGSYYIKWNESFPKPPSAKRINEAAAKEVVKVSEEYSKIATLPAADIQVKLQALSGTLATPQGRMLVLELLSK
jgi:hypothetical protein